MRERASACSLCGVVSLQRFSLTHSGAIQTNRSIALTFHHEQGCTWLDLSETGTYTSPLVYAAFEFRLALERLAFEILRHGVAGDIDEDDLKAMDSFGATEARIYARLGHQRAIDRQIEFINIVLELANTSVRITPFHIGTIRRHWHNCSALCHIQWTIGSHFELDRFRAEALGDLAEARDYLATQFQAMISWPRIDQPEWVNLRDSYVAGTVEEAGVRARLGAVGVYGVIEKPDGTKVFANEFAPPKPQESAG